MHIHTPGTALNDQFGNTDLDSQGGGRKERLEAKWEAYLKAIENQKEVKVLGVTDYLTITNYSKMKKYKESGRLSNIDLLIPNIEFRLTPPTEKATAINIHVLVSPDDPKHEEEIHDALAQLRYEYSERKYGCIPEQLIKFGRAFLENQGNSTPDSEDYVALAAGVEQYRIDFNPFRDWYKGQSWLSKNSIVVVDAGNDGLSGFRTDGAWTGYRQEITKFSQALFSGRPGEREFWLGQRDRADIETIRNLGGLKPCIHGSDAHSLESLFKPSEDRFCWIKADTTFEGLRQILYEPESRVYVGPTPPTMHSRADVIDTVKFEAQGNWFDNFSLPLNSDLVSIIGRKGSGKSALAELIAYAAGSWTPDQAEGFLKRAGKYLQGMKISLQWADGSKTKARIDRNSIPDDNRVCYLSQKFVEQLCADDRQGAELIKKIEEVIFSHIDPTKRLNASSFSELRTFRTRGIQDERSRLSEDIVRLIQESNLLYEKIGTLESKLSRVQELKTERDKLHAQLPSKISSEERRIHVKLETYRGKLAKAEQTVAIVNQKLQKVEDLEQFVDDFQRQMGQYYDKIEPILDEVSMPRSERSLFRPEFPGDPKPAIDARREALQEKVTKHYGEGKAPAPNTVLWFRAEIEELAELASKDQVRQEQIKGIQDKILKINTRIDNLQEEIKEIRGPAKKRRLAIRKERTEIYRSLFENMEREREVLEKLYISGGSNSDEDYSYETDQSFAFTIEREVNLNNWLDRGSALFDQRRNIPFGTMKGFEKRVRDVLAPVWKDGDPKQITEAMDKFVEEGFQQFSFSLQKCLRSGVTAQDVYKWLYEVDHIRLKYGLKYDNVELRNLSPGTKGIVLLLLYLSVDKSDTRPLIVDQPDENLDNESIYKFLKHFRKSKSYRQIILITHNPNLVVNTDSEQVVVANCEVQADGFPHISYNSGALENNTTEKGGIKQQVCRILEGGFEAFQKRQKRYTIRGEQVDST